MVITKSYHPSQAEFGEAKKSAEALRTKLGSAEASADSSIDHASSESDNVPYLGYLFAILGMITT